jgi:hypothetical protein
MIYFIIFAFYHRLAGMQCHSLAFPSKNVTKTFSERRRADVYSDEAIGWHDGSNTLKIYSTTCQPVKVSADHQLLTSDREGMRRAVHGVEGMASGTARRTVVTVPLSGNNAT